MRSPSSRHSGSHRRPWRSQTKSVSSQRANLCSLPGAVSRLTTSTRARSLRVAASRRVGVASRSSVASRPSSRHNWPATSIGPQSHAATAQTSSRRMARSATASPWSRRINLSRSRCAASRSLRPRLSTVRCRVLPFCRNASTTRTYSCLTPLPPAARTTRRNMAPSNTCPCDTSHENQQKMQTEKSQNASYVCPYILEKIKADINNIRYLSIRPRPQRGNMGYDAPEIKAKSRALRHVTIIDPHPRNVPGGKEAIAAEARGRRKAGYALAEDVRYNERSAAERVNGRLKDDFGGRHVRVRGHAKVFCHLMFGVLALAIDQLMRLVT